MRGFDIPNSDANTLPDETPFQAGLALAVSDNPLPRFMDYIEMQKQKDRGEKINPPDLKEMFPGEPVEFDRPMTLDEATVVVERQRMRNRYLQAADHAPFGQGQPFRSFVGSMLGTVLDPVGFGIGVLGGAAFEGAFAVKNLSLAKSIGLSATEMAVGNLATDVAALKPAIELGDNPEFFKQQGMNVLVSSLLGVPFGFLKWRTRVKKHLAGASGVTDAIEGRISAGMNPEDALHMMDKTVAVENSGTHFPEPPPQFVQEQPMYSSSTHYTDDFFDGEHAMRADVGHERGVQMFTNENIAHAGALQAESGNAGAVFEHEITDLNVISGDMRLADLDAFQAQSKFKQFWDKHIGKRIVSMHNKDMIDVILTATDRFLKGEVTPDDMFRLFETLKAEHDVGRPLSDIGLHRAVTAVQNMLEEMGIPDARMMETSLAGAIQFFKRQLADPQLVGPKKYRMEAYFHQFIESLRQDMGHRLEYLGPKKAMDLYKKVAGEYHYLAPFNKDISVKGAYDMMVRAYYEGKISLGELIDFEKSLGADAMHFYTDNYRGHSHAPSNVVYVFDKDSLKPHNVKGVKQAIKEAVGTSDPKNVARIRQLGAELNDPNLKNTKRKIALTAEDYQGAKYFEQSVAVDLNKVNTKDLRPSDIIEQSDRVDIPSAMDDAKKVFEKIDQANKTSLEKAEAINKAMQEYKEKPHVPAEDRVIIENAQQRVKDSVKMEENLKKIGGCIND